MRTRITLHKRHDGSSFEFRGRGRGRGELHFEGKDLDAAARLAKAAHARCPVSRMLSGQSEVAVVAV